MTAVVSAGRRVLPRGWLELGRQLVIWFGFLFAYQIARGVADRNPAKAFASAPAGGARFPRDELTSATNRRPALMRARALLRVD